MNSSPIPQLVLASQSPRRAELLRQINIAFEQCPADTDETVQPGESAEAYVERVARAKAEAVWAGEGAASGRPVLGADTAVVMGEDILGKPRDRQDFMDTLGRLSGRSHQVWSAVALVDAQGSRSRVSVSTVHFRRIDAAELAAYWASGEPADKAGGYAIQGFAAVFVRRLEGSYSGVMGLPLHETDNLLRACGITPAPVAPG